MIQNLTSSFEAGIYDLNTGTQLRAHNKVSFDNTLSTPNKINIKTDDYDNVLTLKNNLSLSIHLSVRIILLSKI